MLLRSANSAFPSDRPGALQEHRSLAPGLIEDNCTAHRRRFTVCDTVDTDVYRLLPAIDGDSDRSAVALFLFTFTRSRREHLQRRKCVSGFRAPARSGAPWA